MIEIDDKKACTGCTACISSCPKSCIVMEPDEEGFMYPKVSIDKCIDCKICERVCPMKRINNVPQIVKSVAAISVNATIRKRSSSGGVFYALSEYVISHGGIVYGVAFDDNWNVVHSHADTIEGIEAFCGSKYVQSSLDGIFKQVLDNLKQKRMVLFSGTPCQIAGLRSFLKVEYETLFTVEVSCHGVPSPKIWRSYLDFLLPDNMSLLEFSFRNKEKGWRGYRIAYSAKQISNVDKFKESSEEHSKNLYYNLFLNNFTLRPSCYSCHFKQGKSGADINIGDCWGVDSSSILNDDGGVSSIIVYTKKGESIINNLSIIMEEIDYDRIVVYNPCLISSVSEPNNRKAFWSDFIANGFRGVKKYYKSTDTVKNRIIKRLLKIKNDLVKR